MTVKGSRQVRLDADVAEVIEAARAGTDRSLSAATNLVLREAFHTATQSPPVSTVADRPTTATQANAAEPRPVSVEPADPRPMTPGSPQIDPTPPVGRAADDPAPESDQASEADRRPLTAVERRRTGVRTTASAGRASSCRHPISRRIGVYCAACGREVTR